MSAAVCYFLVYFSEALILLQYSSNVFEYKISSIKRYMLLTILFIPIYFISFAHIGLLNTALFFVATFVFLKISTMENSATLFFHSAIMIVIMTLCELNHIFAPINNQHSLFCLQSYFHQQKPFHNRRLLSLFYRQNNYLSNQAQFFLYNPHMT